MRRIAVTGTASFLGARLLRAPGRGARRGRGGGDRRRRRRRGALRRALPARWTSPSPPPTSGCSTCCGRRRWTPWSTWPSSPARARDTTYAHELESIGTLNVLAAAAAAGVRHVVLRSFTAVYGARGQNPNFLTEDLPLQPSPGLAWVRDKLEAEQHAASFARRYPQMAVTRAALRAALRARRAHLLHAHLRPARGAGADGLRPAGAAPASRRRGGGVRGGAEPARGRRLQRGARRVPSRSSRRSTSREKVPGAACRIPSPTPPPTCCGRPGWRRRPARFVDYVRYPVRGRRGEGARASWASRRGTPAARRCWPTCAIAIRARPRPRPAKATGVSRRAPRCVPIAAARRRPRPSERRAPSAAEQRSSGDGRSSRRTLRGTGAARRRWRGSLRRRAPRR